VDPVTVAVGSQLLGTLVAAIGAAIADGDQQEADRLRQEAIRQFGPNFAPKLDRLVTEQAQGLTAEDPAIRGRQLRALEQLENVYQSEGNTQADRAALALASNAAAAKSLSDVGTLQQQLASRGGSGASNALLSAAAAQGGTNALGEMGMRNQVAGRQRALSALESGAGLAGQVRGQDAQRASALDSLNRFNTAMRSDTARFNAGQQQQEFHNRFDVAQVRAGLAGSVEADRAQRTRDLAGGLGSSVASAGETWADWMDGRKRRGK
jgi:hypothetical protein